MRNAIFTLAVLLPSVCAAENSALILDLGNGNYIGVVITADGVIPLTSVTIVKPDAPIPPSPDTPWDTSGLHVMVVDDENLRGNLPQSQINIFTSTVLRDWLNANTGSDGQPAFRFSSNDSLKPGSEGRKLELPVWVEGWDILMAAVEKGDVSLPAWIVSNGKTGVIEALPKDVDAAIQRLGEFK